MAACELKGELRYRDGETKTMIVKTENSLKSLISGVKKLNSEVSEVLTSLVEKEKCLSGDGNKRDSPVDEEEDEDDSDEQEDAKETAVVKSNSDGPPAKRLKALKP
ncbi:FK506-binding protein 3 [Colossoma macropomum]|uniref:FK506-binding protein 3 n=1 Tax=Colossoma macropomum TaxID=42526 RepID=UPI00186483CD|nr:FK506-binding protein 3 [Colossoma macropomum]